MVTIYDRHAFPRVVHILDQYRLVEDFSPSSLALSIKVFRER